VCVCTYTYTYLIITLNAQCTKQCMYKTVEGETSLGQPCARAHAAHNSLFLCHFLSWHHAPSFSHFAPCTMHHHFLILHHAPCLFLCHFLILHHAPSHCKNRRGGIIGAAQCMRPCCLLHPQCKSSVNPQCKSSVQVLSTSPQYKSSVQVLSASLQ